MKRFKVIVGSLLLTLAILQQPLHAMTPQSATADASIARVNKEMSLLDQIIEQANIIVDSPDQIARNHAKQELTKLINHKELAVNIKNLIKDDVETIKNAKTKSEQHEARERLLATYTKINSQANVVEAIAESTEMVKNASPEELEETIAQAKENIKEAEEQEQGIVSRWYAKAKRMITAPVDYVFGKESSYAKTAFYTAVGIAVLAAGTYGTYGLYQRYKYTENKQKLIDFDSEMIKFLDELIAETAAADSPETPIHNRYAGQVKYKSDLQIEKYVKERKNELSKLEPTSQLEIKKRDDQLHALSEFEYFFNKHWLPGHWDANILLRNPENLNSNSPYLQELTSTMSTHGGKISLIDNDLGTFKTMDEANNARTEFLNILEEYSNTITNNEKELSEKTGIPQDKLYKAELSKQRLADIEELEKSVQPPTWWQRMLGTK